MYYIDKDIVVIINLKYLVLIDAQKCNFQKITSRHYCIYIIMYQKHKNEWIQNYKIDTLSIRYCIYIFKYFMLYSFLYNSLLQSHLYFFFVGLSSSV